MLTGSSSARIAKVNHLISQLFNNRSIITRVDIGNDGDYTSDLSTRRTPKNTLRFRRSGEYVIVKERMTSTATPGEINVDWGLNSFDPWDNRLRNSNVWAIYRAMRDAGAVVHSNAQGGLWCITRFEEVRSAARDFKSLSSLNVLDIGNSNKGSADRTRRLIELDPPEHTRHRKIMQAPFLTSNVGKFESGIRQSVGKLLDRITELKYFDIVHDLAEPVPQEILAKILGFDQETSKRNRELVLRLVNADLTAREKCQKEFREFLTERVSERRLYPRDDYLSEMCRSGYKGERFSESELVGMVMGFALAGHHTSINAIASMLMRASNEKVKSAYFSDPTIAPRIVEETLRYDPPIHLEGRTTTVPVRIGDVEIPAGESVVLLYASANHDERQFENPEVFDPHRRSLSHLSFGHGIHMCIGLNLARMEMGIILDAVMDRFPGYSLRDEPVETGMVFGHHMGWQSMPATIAC